MAEKRWQNKSIMETHFMTFQAITCNFLNYNTHTQKRQQNPKHILVIQATKPLLIRITRRTNQKANESITEKNTTVGSFDSAQILARGVTTCSSPERG